MDIRSVVRDKYSSAATISQSDLCCPKDYPNDMISHIPRELFDFNYGCGSPVTKARINSGEHIVDLGSGVGIDCFVAAKIVGPKGKVTGVDMTDEMVNKARSYQEAVCTSLGYWNIEFVNGHIEQIPLPDASADVIISNCVLNLSDNKEAVFQEIIRVLKSGGRTVISDIVSDREILENDRNNRDLWGGCYGGVLSLRNFIESFLKTGFSGITQISESPWKVVAGYRFSSITITAYKLAKGDLCNYLGQKAVYLGPYAQVVDDSGHIFPRFKPVTICTDTAINLKKSPYAENFLVTGPSNNIVSLPTSCCDSM